MDLPALNPFRGKRRFPLTTSTAGPFERMHEEIDRLFDEFMPQLPTAGETDFRHGLLATVDVGETDEAVEVTADLPGIEQKDIDVSLRNGNLLIRGERKQETEEKKKNFYRAERSYGAFSRSVPLPCEVDQDRIEARFRNGVLTVILPKSQTARESERKIEIKAA